MTRPDVVLNLPAAPGRHADGSARPNGYWGMAVFLCTDAVMFALLLVAHVYLRRHSTGAGGRVLDPGTTAWLSVVLWASSGSLILAERLKRSATASGLLYVLTAALGVTFALGQLREYGRLAQLGATVDANLFTTGFYTVTALHGLHVLVGAPLLALTGALRLRGLLGERRAGFTAGLGLYWHFVDAVWAVVFLTVYVWRGP